MDYFAYLKLFFIPFLAALSAVWVIHPHIVKIARDKDIVDSPNTRKLQKEPVPVLGGVAVFFGIVIGLTFANIMIECENLFVLLAAMLLMLYMGTMDDILGLRAITRLIVQIGAALVLVYLGDIYIIDNMLGLFGFRALPHEAAVALTVFASVGIINATNLIDGVDGLSSGFGMLASLLLSFAFYFNGDYPMVMLCAATIGALLLFFLHNVFGKTSKMFIGDGGSLVLGIILAACVSRLINSTQGVDPATLPNTPSSVIPFTLAVLSIPVFDTLRVMIARVCKRKSPFSPDKTHLHHMFIELGFSHIITTVSILSLNTLVVGIWGLLYFGGFSVRLQTAAVFVVGLSATVGFYYSMRAFRNRNPERFMRMAEYIRSKQPRRDGWFLVIRNIVDKR